MGAHLLTFARTSALRGSLVTLAHICEPILTVTRMSTALLHLLLYILQSASFRLRPNVYFAHKLTLSWVSSLQHTFTNIDTHEYT